jgi:hypothetical protein
MEYLFSAADLFSPAPDETGLEPVTAFAAADSTLTAPEPSLPLVDVDRQEHQR